MHYFILINYIQEADKLKEVLCPLGLCVAFLPSLAQLAPVPLSGGSFGLCLNRFLRLFFRNFFVFISGCHIIFVQLFSF